MKGNTKEFWFKAWAHPKQGGDDYSLAGDIVCDSRKTAVQEVKKILRKEKSAVLTDYKVKEVIKK